MAMQNYAKFESRVEDTMTSTPQAQYNAWSYTESSYDYNYSYWWWSISDTVWNLFDWLFAVLWVLLVIWAIWYFIYIIISMIWKWARETLTDIQNHIKFIFWKVGQFLNFIWTKIKNIWIYLRNHKRLSVLIIIVLL